jgi:hemolysin III
MALAPAAMKPKLRGVFHELAFYASIVVGIPLVLTAEPGRARASAIVFASCVALCFGASALYHRPTWQPRTRSWLARLDHAGIYFLIAGTYTPFGLLVMSTGWAIPVLSIVWTGSAAGILLKLFRPSLPKRVSASIGIGLGWVAAVAFSQLLKLPVIGLVLLLIGGLAYTVGAVAYALKRPNPYPGVLGYHEVFHLCTLIAAGCQYAAIAFYVLPRA